MADKKRNKSNKPSDSKINRRDFINLVGKAAIPTIAFLSLGRIGDLIAKPGNGNENPEEPSKAPTDCIFPVKEVAEHPAKASAAVLVKMLAS